ncbi:hypothetical protein Tco_1506844 [Tanacetum coccineum]
MFVEDESFPVYDTNNEEKEDGDEEEVVNADYEEAPPIETPELQKLDVNDDPVDALNINKLDDSHVVEFELDASSAGLSHTKIFPVAVEIFVIAESDVIGEPQFTQEVVSLDFVLGLPCTQRNKDYVMVVDKLGFKSIKVRGRVVITKGNLMQGIQS